MPKAPMTDPLYTELSRRERQIMDVIYELGEAACGDVVGRLPDEPSYSTVRVTMGILEKKGFLAHHRDGARFVYTPTIPVARAERSALSHVLKTYFRRSPAGAIMALLDMNGAKLSKRELDEITAAIQQARKEP